MYVSIKGQGVVMSSLILKAKARLNDPSVSRHT
jgi:hypothetical protein